MLGISNLGRALLSESEKLDALLFKDAAADHTKNDTKEKRAVTLFNPVSNFSCAVGLLKKLKSVHKKTFPASESSFE